MVDESPVELQVQSPVGDITTTGTFGDGYHSSNFSQAKSVSSHRKKLK